MLAAVDYLLPIYRQANTYAHLLNERVSGNPERRRPDELHAQAWKLIEPYFRRAQEEAFSQYHRLAGTGRTSTEIRDILPAAAHGRVACLCLAVGLQQWGTYAADTGAIEMHSEAQPGDEDLLDLAAMLTVSNSGTVYAVEPARVPGGAPLAAIYRY